MYDPVAYGVSQSGFAYFKMPAGNVELGTKHRGCPFMARFNYFKQITGLVLLQREEQPFVQNKKLYLFILLYYLSIRTVTAGNGVSCKLKIPRIAK